MNGEPLFTETELREAANLEGHAQWIIDDLMAAIIKMREQGSQRAAGSTSK